MCLALILTGVGVDATRAEALARRMAQVHDHQFPGQASWLDSGGASPSEFEVLNPLSFLASGVTGSACLLICASAGFYADPDGWHWYFALGGVGLGGAVSIHLPLAEGVCSAKGWSLGLSVVNGAGGGGNLPSSPANGWWSAPNVRGADVAGSVGFGGLVSGGPSYAWMSGC
jgi:hypothetical protein